MSRLINAIRIKDRAVFAMDKCLESGATYAVPDDVCQEEAEILIRHGYAVAIDPAAESPKDEAGLTSEDRDAIEAEEDRLTEAASELAAEAAAEPEADLEAKPKKGRA